MGVFAIYVRSHGSAVLVVVRLPRHFAHNNLQDFQCIANCVVDRHFFKLARLAFILQFDTVAQIACGACRDAAGREERYERERGEEGLQKQH